MHITQHAHARMAQRGITRSMIDLVLEYGEISQDKTYLDRKRTQQLVKELKVNLQVAKKIFGKASYVVAKDNEDDVVTNYN